MTNNEAPDGESDTMAIDVNEDEKEVAVVQHLVCINVENYIYRNS